MNKKVLIIGGAGLLGASLANELKGSLFFSGVTIGDIINPHCEGVNYEKLDVLDETNLSAIISRFDIIVNCAGQVTSPIQKCFELNTRGMSNLLRALVGTDKKLYHISTVAVYGCAAFADETTLCNPETPYAACKAFAEYQITSLMSEDNYCIMRLSNLYGEKQTKGVFNYLLSSLKSDKSLIFNNNGKMIRYFLHVDDCARILRLTLENELKGIYNLCGPDKFTVLELIDIVESSSKIKYSLTLDAAEPSENIIELSDKKLESKLKLNYGYSVRSYFADRLIQT